MTTLAKSTKQIDELKENLGLKLNLNYMKIKLRNLRRLKI